ncbi:MAG: hypothetical protein AAGG44_13585, partial [Planctomycetota bacterium]
LPKWSYVEERVWDTNTGQVIPSAPWAAPQEPIHANANRIMTFPSSSSVLLVDQNLKNTPRERAYRRFKAKPKPWWHEQQLEIAESAQNYYSAAFHAGHLLQLDPDSQTAFTSLHTAVENLSPASRPLLPKAVMNALELPSPQPTANDR